ncbi:citrate/2-methylcitrate synthase [Teredinibacter turnerae]|uniref:citrate/2-methylcitrate synthase n=1 Tax=Teredinibacter turnerae TaxID=2426 RepID=UPI00036054AC|nr:citrate/2-methylcitrate synthase [Teredinibacter turnerae]
MSNSAAREVKRRDDVFVEKTQTKIWLEKPSESNPYIAETSYCHGYEIFDLMKNCSLVEVIYLLFKGELPTEAQKTLLEQLMIGLINPGPRHAATRAAMNTGVGKTNPVHILPIAAIVMGGERDCGGAIEDTMRFFRKNFRQPAEDVAEQIMATENVEDWPGFGQIYGGRDIQTTRLAETLLALEGAGEIMQWAANYVVALAKANAGWLPVGLAAAVFADLGFHPKLGGPVYQMITAPGLIAHGFELYTKPLTSMPYVKDEDYEIKN